MSLLERKPGGRPLSDVIGAGTFAFLLVSAFASSWQLALLTLPLQIQNLLLVAAFLVRRRPFAAARGILPKATAYANSFLILAFLNVASRWRPDWLAPTPVYAMGMAGMLLNFLGVLLSLPAIWQLRRAFSIEPAARELQVRGAYRWARHPIYACYIVQFTGLLLWRLTLPVAAVFVAYLVLTWLRIRYEEQVLLAAFPEYEAYRRSVGALGPRLRAPGPRGRAADPAAQDATGEGPQGTITSRVGSTPPPR